ncbi:hypothetical protein AN963_27620 [Brevibacillus choshinensis]|uniref:Uncharacterized protein n=1 Tax=Brevibacillus choshinensis TaxID=54911 RepID=A0ABR5N3J6_BRECH|nr:hypothetical protein AN963_27620 [Brevibacillus choshinensis]
MEYPTFQYFMSHYHDEINGGGTFTLVELIQLFSKMDSNSMKSKLLLEAKQIKQTLLLEDCEQDRAVINLCNKYSKSKIKRIVELILIELN